MQLPLARVRAVFNALVCASVMLPAASLRAAGGSDPAPGASPASRITSSAGMASGSGTGATVTSAPPLRAQAVTDIQLHAAPGSRKGALGRVARGTWLELRGCGQPAGWCEVAHGDRSAWVPAEALGAPMAPPAAIILSPSDEPIVIHVSPRRDSPR